MHDMNAKWFYSKNMIVTQQDHDKDLLITNVEHIEGNVRFYLYLYPLGT